MEYYLAVKKKEILPFVTASMDLESIMLSEISQSEKDKYRMIWVICGIKCTKWTNKIVTDLESRVTAIGGGRLVGGWRRWTKEKKFMDMDNSVVIVSGEEWELDEGKGG